MNVVTQSVKKYPAQILLFIENAEKRGLNVVVIDEVNDGFRHVNVKVTRPDIDETKLSSILDSYETYCMAATLSLHEWSNNRWAVRAYETDYNVPLRKISLKTAQSAVRFGFHGFAKVGA
jgi:hypothetical protein